jgi:hypothetical protein
MMVWAGAGSLRSVFTTLTIPRVSAELCALLRGRSPLRNVQGGDVDGVEQGCVVQNGRLSLAQLLPAFLRRALRGKGGKDERSVGSRSAPPPAPITRNHIPLSTPIAVLRPP